MTRTTPVICRPVSPGAFNDAFAEFPITDDGYDGAESPPGIPADADTNLFARRTFPVDGLRVQFLGTNSIHLSDGQTNLLIDPYFTRPNLPPVLMTWCSRINIAPDPERIQTVISLAGIDNVDAILMTHAHYDHALDIAEVASCLAQSNGGTYPQIIGSESIYLVAVGGNVPDSSITVTPESDPDSESYHFGGFRVTFIRGRHVHVPVLGRYISGRIEKTVIPPANVFDYKEGGTYAIYIQHALGSILNIGSANYRPGAFDNIGHVDNLIIGVAGLCDPLVNSFEVATYQRDFYAAVVEATNPSRVLFSHWDDFNLALDRRPEWFGGAPGPHQAFLEFNPDLEPEFLPIWGFIEL